MSYLVDSDVVADWLNGKEHTVQLLANFEERGLAISLITYGEIYEGIYYGKNPEKARRIFLQFLRKVDVLPLNRRIMQRFAEIRGALRHKGQLIGDPDILIDATAIHHDLTLLTRNTKDFSRIPDLKLYQSNKFTSG
ncbi:MAG: type II toxin-antitoxin system VapC family toxin [Chloroflexi bacterium]|nr:type II toxin-antitoxin system VapC family toxin [Chloroflexota bacterium]